MMDEKKRKENRVGREGKVDKKKDETPFNKSEMMKWLTKAITSTLLNMKNDKANNQLQSFTLIYYHYYIIYYNYTAFLLQQL